MSHTFLTLFALGICTIHLWFAKRSRISPSVYTFHDCQTIPSSPPSEMLSHPSEVGWEARHSFNVYSFPPFRQWCISGLNKWIFWHFLFCININNLLSSRNVMFLDHIIQMSSLHVKSIGNYTVKYQFNNWTCTRLDIFIYRVRPVMLRKTDDFSLKKKMIVIINTVKISGNLYSYIG